MMEKEQAIQLLFEEWKYLHDYFWRSLFRWAGAVVTLWVIPFVKPDIFKAWPKIVLFFPCMACILAIFSAWLLGAEQRRLKMVIQKYNEMRKEFLPPRIPRDTKVDRLFAAELGNKIIWIYGVGLALLSVLIFVLIWRSLQ